MAYDKAVDSAALDAGLTSVADAIRQKGGTSASLSFPGGFAEAIAAIPAGGGDTLTDFIEDKLTEIKYDGTAKMQSYFAYQKAGLKAVYMPNVLNIGSYAFFECTNVEACDFRSITLVSPYVFYGFGAGHLAVMHLPEVTTLSSFSLGKMGTPEKPVTIVLPKLKTFGSQCFRETYAMAIDIGPDINSQIPSSTFYGGQYNTVIFRRSSAVITAANTNALKGLTSATTVYIPKALYDHLGDGSALDYKSTTNWTSVAALVQWACIEGSQYENAYADGTPIV